MGEINYNLQFEKLCNILNLGELTEKPKAVSGGFLHKMYAVETTKGKYAIKALNPQIMLRPVAMQHFYNSERIANLVANKIPALPALSIEGTSIHEIDHQYFLVFNWVEAKSLQPNEIDIYHCEKIGSILAHIHLTDFRELGIINDGSDDEMLSDWSDYLSKGQEINAEWELAMSESIEQLYSWNMDAINSTKRLKSSSVISHRDLDPKNVIWDKDIPILIDWESAGYINPMQDLIETAIYWSIDDKDDIDKVKFMAFIQEYIKVYGTLEANWAVVLKAGFSAKLGWLEYNLKRSLKIECNDENEQQMGTRQVLETLTALSRYADMILELEKWLYNDL